MLTDLRWRKEQELMRSVFPQFKPFTKRADFGFEGRLRGPKTGQVYNVLLKADQKTYPQLPPIVCMNPRIGNHWIDRNRRRALCVMRDWQSARSTFANTLLAVLRFLAEHDGVLGCEPAAPCGAR